MHLRKKRRFVETRTKTSIRYAKENVGEKKREKGRRRNIENKRCKGYI